jgi:hypothetical protein
MKYLEFAGVKGYSLNAEIMRREKCKSVQVTLNITQL